MAFSISHRRNAAGTLLDPRVSERSVGYAVRALLVLYLIAVTALHIATVPTIFANQRIACEPGSCFGGQVNAGTFDWLASRGISPTLYALVVTFLGILIPVIGSALAAVTIWQRPTAWMPMLFIVAIATCSISASGALYVLTAEHPGW
jgi:hypothetical protein